MTDHMYEARKLAVSLGRDYPDVVERIAAALSAAEHRERERILSLIELFPQDADGPAEAFDRVEWAINNIAAAILGAKP